MNTTVAQKKMGRKPKAQTKPETTQETTSEIDFNTAVKLQYQLTLMRTGEEPELPSAMEKRIGVEATKKKMQALHAELVTLQMS